MSLLERRADIMIPTDTPSSLPASQGH